MRSYLNTLLGWLRGPRPKLRCSKAIWSVGVAELGRRTLGGRRESGAFLLGLKDPDGVKRILEFVYYDDIDERALETGAVVIRNIALPRVWELCRQRGYGVVADIHVHPGGYGQSVSDQESPVIPRAGHMAIILPNSVRTDPVPGRIGIYEFQGGTEWLDHSKRGQKVFRIEDN